jgi:thiosulfate/3-mercaptopyruvate sulfurtransferase
MTMGQRMLRPGRTRSWPAIAHAAVVATALIWLSPAGGGAAEQSTTSSEPWTAANTVRPADLVQELAKSTGTNKPVVVCAAPAFLYRNGHVPGALFHGPASTKQGLSDLRRWAQSLSRSTNLVVYCGCCPLDQCPNLRPAFGALRDMGFTRLRVLVLPNSFGIDWVEKGYPVEK